MTQVQESVLAEIENKNGERELFIKKHYRCVDKKENITDEEYEKMLIEGR